MIDYAFLKARFEVNKDDVTRLENDMSQYRAQINTLKRRESKMVSKIEKALNSTLDGDKLTSKFMRNFVEDDK